MAHILLRHRDVPDIHQLPVYEEHGGYAAWKQALGSLTPDQVREEVRKANIKGRGGAGFPAGIKWGFIPKTDAPKYVVINADESETGTFKDRELIEANPHQVIEGALLCAYAIKAQTIYIYFRGEFLRTAAPFEQALQDAYAAGYIGQNVLDSGYSVDFYTHYGAGAYICGEETALLNSLMGNLGQPWSKPPFPAVQGLYASPTVVNNVETLANVPPVIVNGADWYLKMGTPNSPGPKIVCLSGRVNKPGNYEVEMGKTTYRELIYEMGEGIPDDKKVKAIFPSGGSGAIVTAAALDAPISFEGLEPHGSMMGSASVIVCDETVDMVWAAMKAVHFFKHESCGKCTPCREGTFWLDKVLHRVYYGHGRPEDITLLKSVAGQIQGKCLCALGEFAINPVLSAIRLFPQEFEAKVKLQANGHAGKQPTPRPKQTAPAH